MMAFGPPLATFSSPVTSRRKIERNATVRKSRSRLVGSVRAIRNTTTKLSTPSSRKTLAGPMPANFSSSATVTAATDMNAALSTFTAAITRARRSAPAHACTAEKVGTMKSPPPIARPMRSSATWMAGGCRKTSPIPCAVAAGTTPWRVQPRSSAKMPSRSPPISVGTSTMRPWQSHEARPEPRERNRADEPEPARHQAAPPQPRLRLEVAQQLEGRGRDIALDDELRRPLAGARNEAGEEPAQHREHHHQAAEQPGIAFGGVSARDRADQDGEEGCCLDQRVAGGQLGFGEMVGQDAVLDRTEQCSDDAEPEQRDEERDDRVFDRMHPQQQSDHRDAGDEDLGELQPFRNHGLVVAVRHLPAQSRKNEVREDEDGGRELNEGPRALARKLEDDQDHQRLLEEIVVEGAEELAPEQGCEAPRGHQAREHQAVLRRSLAFTSTSVQGCDPRPPRRCAGGLAFQANPRSGGPNPPLAVLPTLTSLAACGKSPAPGFLGSMARLSSGPPGRRRTRMRQKGYDMAWTRVAAAAELKERGVMDAEVNGEEIALYWVEDAPYATENICTHAFARLSEGFLDGDCIECPVHQALFNVKTGEAVSPPAYQAVKTFPCKVEGDDIVIEV